VPIAIAANAARVTITGLLSEVNPNLAEGLAHLASGWLIFMLALAILVLVHVLFNRVYNLLHGRK
jgi:exosortase/archaeosortase family protein